MRLQQIISSSWACLSAGAGVLERLRAGCPRHVLVALGLGAVPVAAQEAGWNDELPLGRVVAGTPLYTVLPESDAIAAAVPIHVLRERNPAEVVEGFLGAELVASPAVSVMRLGGGSAGGYGPVLATPTVFTRGVDADFELGLAPFSGASLASSAVWQAGVLSGRNAAFISNLGADAPADDWLIGPPNTVTAGEPVSLTFDYFQSGSDAGSSLRVYVSSTYAGGVPNPAAWTEITPAGLAAGASNSWRAIGPVGVNGFTGNNVRIAFRYTSSGTTASTARVVGIDNVALFQNVYLPPEIETFTADGVPLANGAVFTKDPSLAVTASNLAQVARAEFAYRVVGSENFTTLGSVTQTSGGMTAVWPVSQIADGDYELVARLWNGGKATERMHTVTVALAAPAVPVITQPSGPLTTTALTQTVRVTAANGALVRLFRNGSQVGSGRPVGGAALQFPVELLLGENAFTATAENRAGVSAVAGPVVVTRERPIPVLALTVGSGALVEGDSMAAEVRLNAALTEPIEITLSSSRPTEISASEPVTIPAGQTVAAFTVRALSDNRLQPVRSVTLEATAARALPVRRSFTLIDDDIPLLTLELSRTVISEADGSQAILATLTRDVTAEAQVMRLERSLPGQWTAPAEIEFTQGEASVSFPIGVVDNAVPDGGRTATIRAVLAFSDGTAASSSPTQTVTITDDDSPQLQLVYGREFIREGQQETVRVRRIAGDLSAAVEVVLEASSARVLPQTPVVIPAGEVETVAVLDAPANEVANDTQVLTLSATAAGHGAAQIPLVVIDSTLPDLVARDIDSVAEVATEANFNVRYRVENVGLAATSTAFLERVYLSTDNVVGGGDLLVSEQISPAVVAVDGGYDRQLLLRAPVQAGVYWLLVQVDSAGQIGEILETNNVGVFATQVTVGAAYRATVSTPQASYPANTPIPLSGVATQADGTRVPFVPVNLHIARGPTTRVISAITDADGAFAISWQPLVNEGGDYTVGATHPGVAEVVVQDAFSVLAFTHDLPPRSPLVMDEGGTISRGLRVTNPSAMLPLTGVKVDLLDGPEGLGLVLNLPSDTLEAGGIWDLALEFSAPVGLFGNHVAVVRLTSREGVVMDIPVALEIRPLTPQLVVEPGTLKTSVVRGQQKSVSLTLRNTGGAATGAVELLLPNLPWLRVASVNPLPGLAPGEVAEVSLLLSPSSSQPLTLTTGSMVARPAVGRPVTVPFEIRTVSSLFGDLRIDVVNEFFFFTEAAPKVAGATVVVRDAVTAEEIARAVTPATGEVVFPNLQEGYYQVDVSAPQHTPRQARVFVAAGDANSRQFFISRELVTYSWRVEEVEIADRYEITVETTFETNVPAPVVTITPGRIDVGDLVGLGATKVVNLTIENHGLIAAEAGALRFDDHPFYRFEPLIEGIGTLAARSRIVVPVVVTRVGVFGADDQIVTIDGDGRSRSPRNGGRPRVSCVVSAGLPFSYECGENDVGKEAPLAVSGVQGHCPDSGPGGGGGGIAQPQSPPGGGSSGGPGPTNNSTVSVPVATVISFPTPTTCDCPLFTKICRPFSPKINLGAIGKQLGAMISAALPPYLKVGTVEVTLSLDGEICLCCEDGRYGWSGSGTAKAEVKIPITAGLSAEKEFEFAGGGFDKVTASVSGLLGGKAEVTGTLTASGGQECLKGMKWCVGGTVEGTVFIGGELTGSASAVSKDPESGAETTFSGSLEGRIGITGKVSASVSGCSDTGLTFKACATTVPVAEVKSELKSPFGSVKPVESSVDFEKYRVGGCSDGSSPKNAPRDDDFPDDGRPWDRDEDTPVTAVIPASEYEVSDEELFARYAPGIFKDEGVCAKVRVRLSQQLVLTRTAFQATLELGNNQPESPLTEVGFDLTVRDLNGEPADDAFNIRVTELRGLDAVDGSGTVAAGGTGSAQWTIIPRDTAAPDLDTRYFVGGTIRYTQGGVRFSVPVTAVPITVRPDAQLYLKYFHQRDVFADDPFTTAVIEPSIPYALAVLVENRGAGAARNLSITSAQPQIVDNEKGLLIDFSILGTEVNGQPMSPSLTTRFGDLAPLTSAVGVWRMKSSLQGLFTDYKASFEHIDGLGDSRLSLIREVEIHEMNRLVRVQGALDDSLPDFLVNDVPDFNHFPDTLHFSHGGTAPVVVRESAAVTRRDLPGGLVELDLVTPLGAGWGYLRIADPLAGGMILQRCVRSDGRELPLDFNVWRTDRTFPGMNQKARYENVLHLFDGDSTGRYTLVFGPTPDADVTAPVSAVRALAAQSPALIELAWDGTDDTGVEWFDVFVSEDGGAWVPWLTRTTQRAALFSGVQGKTYGFYSRSADAAGNVEVKAANADTVTTVSLANQPPVVTPPGVVAVDAGRTLTLQVVAVDPDGPEDLLRHALVSGPPGMTVDALSGQLRWVTSRADGGRSVNVRVRVTDGGLPAAQAEMDFQVQVRRVNTPPELSPVPARSLAVGETLIQPLVARDVDLPTQALTFSILGGAPAGMTLDAATGLLSWTAVSSQAGRSFQVEIAVTDDGEPAATTTRQVALSVAAVPLGPPVFAALPVPLWLTGTPQVLEILATDPDGTPVTIQSAALPPGAILESVAGSGRALLRWTPVAEDAGIRTIPLTATTPGEATQATLTVRIEQPSDYWEWALANLGAMEDAGDYGMMANPDDDDAVNLIEMMFFRNPLVVDATPLDFEKIGDLNDQWSVFRMEFLRHQSATKYVRMRPLHSEDLGVWRPLDPWAVQPRVQPPAADDAPLSAEEVELRLLMPRDADQGFFKLETTILPQWLAPAP